MVVEVAMLGKNGLYREGAWRRASIGETLPKVTVTLFS